MELFYHYFFVRLSIEGSEHHGAADHSLGLLSGNPAIRADDSVTSGLVSRIEHLEQTLKSIQVTGTEMKQELDSLRAENRKLRFEMNTCTCGNGVDVKKRLIGVSGSTESTIAFSAYINHSMDHVTPGTAIPFEMVTTNEGNAFHGPTGLFSCPRSGLYLFVWNISIDAGYSTQVKLLVNGQTRRWSYAGSSQHWTNGANHDIVRLQVGDRVWIADDYANGAIHPHHTTFSGVLIAQ